MTRGPDQAYGIASVAEKLRGVDFPVSRKDLLQKAGNEEIQWEKDGKSLTLRECLENVDQDRFNSVTEVTQAVSKSIR